MKNHGSINIDVDHIQVRSRAGVHIDEAIKEAVILSLLENENVNVSHNSKTYKIFPYGIISYVKEQSKLTGVI